MQIRLAYGKTGLTISVDDAWNVQVIEPQFVPGLPNPIEALQGALQSPVGTPPLAQLVKPGDRVGIIFNDITRPTPNPLMLKALLNELGHIPKDHIFLFIALGTHRPDTEAEIRTMLGEQALAGYTIIQNNAFDKSTQVCIGETSRGNPIWVNRQLMDCDIKILTGFIEPHFFAGFSGAGKAIMPGMGGQDTIFKNHNAANIGSPKATWGNTWGNPIWEEIQEAARSAGQTFLLNVTLNREKAITGIFAGDLIDAHAQGVEFVRKTAMAAVEEPFDIVVTTNSGYPLDLNLYQSVKGMSAAAQVVREGGAIICAAECWDGIPDHGLYGQLLREARSPQDLLDTIMAPGYLKQDQWQAQIQAQIQLKADVYVYSSYLTDEQVRGALLKPSSSVESTLADLVNRYGASARICILPEGPQTIPYLSR